VIPEHPKEHAVRVVVQAGTLERLVDILVHGLPGISVSISDDNGEMPLKDGRTRDAKLDRGDFSSIWWNVFRSFVTPLVFLRYVADLLSMSSSPTKSLYSLRESAMSAPEYQPFLSLKSRTSRSCSWGHHRGPE